MMHPYISESKIKRLLIRFLEKETPFQIQQLLGKGSYGLAYLLNDKNTGNQYVLKRMRTKYKNRHEVHMKFKQEIAMLQQLALPNTPKVLLEGDVEGIPFYIMEFIDGRTFEQEIFYDRKTYSLEQSFLILKELLSVVIKIHDANIVHRDLRIPNILIKNDALYIIDFGLASYMKSVDDTKVVENPKKLEDHRSDLYYIGHFLLYLIYSSYKPTSRFERSWQQELQLPTEVEQYIERLLLIGPAFSNAEEALQSIPFKVVQSN